MTTNRFDHLTSKIKNQGKPWEDSMNESSRSVQARSLQPEPKRIGRDAYETLMGLLAEDRETPTTPYGVLLANSTKRNIRKSVEALLIP